MLSCLLMCLWCPCSCIELGSFSIHVWTLSPCIVIPIIKIRWSGEHLMFMMWIPIFSMLECQAVLINEIREIPIVSSTTTPKAVGIFYSEHRFSGTQKRNWFHRCDNIKLSKITGVWIGYKLQASWVKNQSVLRWLHKHPIITVQ